MSSSSRRSRIIISIGILLVLSWCHHHVAAFHIPNKASRRRHGAAPSLFMSTMIDFDYEAPNPGNIGYQSNLTSLFPPGMPAGLRGEAVRSALQSGRCLVWCFQDDNKNAQQQTLSHGLVQVQGKGCLEFLNNKLSNSFSSPSPQQTGSTSSTTTTFRQAGVLTGRGRIIDCVGVATADDNTRAWVQTSPGHAASDLFDRWDPFVFPLDQVKLSVPAVWGITLASIRGQDVVQAFEQYIRPALGLATDVTLPMAKNECLLVTNEDDDGQSCLQLLATPCIHLPEVAAVGYTFWFANVPAGRTLWESFKSDAVHAQGPIAIGPLEYESLRIQAGSPGYDAEMTGRREKETNAPTPATPLELHQAGEVLDLDKGCYMGQEGIASVIKNPRGPPRLLYQVVFSDEFNLYDSETIGEAPSSAAVENLTRFPQPGDVLYVLGSNEEIQVGALTSVAEPSSTGDAETLALALVRRSDSILQAMEKLDLEIPRVYDVLEQDTSSGIIRPPPMDPLDGLEVIVQGTFTVGTLRSIPSRRLPPGRNMFADDVPDFVNDFAAQDGGSVDVTRVPLAGGLATGDIYEPRRPKPVDSSAVNLPVHEDEPAEAEWEKDIGEEDAVDADTDEDADAALEQARLEAEAAKAAAEAAAAEAARKEAKMEMLRKRSEEAMARRKARAEAEAAEAEAAAEAARKEAKMEMLRKRAEEAMARRKAKKNE